MRKVLYIFLVLAGINFTAIAQENAAGTGVQTTNLALSDAIEITYDNGTASSVNIPFTSISQLVNGVMSEEQHLKVRSNKKFKVTVTTNSSNFSYVGSAITNNVISVASGLKIMVTNNKTGGRVPLLSFLTSWLGFNGSTPTTLINNCKRGGNQTFSVKYLAIPGASAVPGTYVTDVVFTATQL